MHFLLRITLARDNRSRKNPVSLRHHVIRTLTFSLNNDQRTLLLEREDEVQVHVSHRIVTKLHLEQ